MLIENQKLTPSDQMTLRINPSVRNSLSTLSHPFLSRQYQRLPLDTKPQLIQNLQSCTNLTLTTLNHTNVLKFGFSNDTFTSNHLINAYIRLRHIDKARNVFDEIPDPNVVSWTAMIAGYVTAKRSKFSISLYKKMIDECLVIPNAFTIATVVNACSISSDIETGKIVHSHVEVMGFKGNLVVCASLVDMYMKCNDVDNARRVFEAMEFRNVVAWTSMISGYAQNGRGEDAIRVFREFGLLLERPNGFMLASVVNACASLGRLVLGKVAHGTVIRRGYNLNDVVASSLVDMYAKCGSIGYCRKVFDNIRCPSVIPYTSMIVGAAKYGLGKLSLDLFREMIGKDVKPNDITFVGVLHACSHSGLVDDGLEYLNSMFKDYGVMPDAKHYTCVVDMLGRSGRLDDAYRLAKSVRVNVNEGALLWGTLLSASRLHGKVDIAREASRWLIASNQQVAGAYVTMSNAYALAGDWKNVCSLRAQMKSTGISKEPGCSWVEIKDSTYVFYAGDVSSCVQTCEILRLLKELEGKMKERGYVGGSSGLVFVDVEDEAKDEIVGLHSERLALAFALINVPRGITIRIMKNLRMCSDCHEAFKMISEIVVRDFVVRDVNRFHHFSNGSCNCEDFW